MKHTYIGLCFSIISPLWLYIFCMYKYIACTVVFRTFQLFINPQKSIKFYDVQPTVVWNDNIDGDDELNRD